MEFLYVCLFSNGHIKVGRSIDPQARMASHAERVACVGIELSDSFTVECGGPASPCETRLIRRCTDQAGRRFQNEWFDGLDFLAVCGWAVEAASSAIESEQQGDDFGGRLREARHAAGLTQSQLGTGLGNGGYDLLKASISSWEANRNQPNVTQLRLLCQRLGVSADQLLGLALRASQVEAA